MKRLFSVGNNHFGSKRQAKAYRNEHGGHVSKGPDHKDYNKAPKTHIGTKGHKQGQPVGR